jgi:glucose/arabinose dehydrogenase
MNSTYTAATRQGVVVGPDGWAASQNGRHGGCRLRFGGAGALWISTGDAAVGTNPQDLTRLNGKTLRVDPATGQGAAGNPFAGSGNTNTRRIYTYGHRNAQGLAPRPGGGMWEVEQGTFRDDEVNLLIAGGNYGWDPVPGYDETTPMTDLTQFPGAQVARWSSGHPTVASSGGGWIDHERWGAWDGALAVACLKQEDIRVLHFDGAGVLQSAELPPELDGTFGRLRQPVVNPAGIMYIAGDGGITQVVPVGPGPV